MMELTALESRKSLDRAAPVRAARARRRGRGERGAGGAGARPRRRAAAGADDRGRRGRRLPAAARPAPTWSTTRSTSRRRAAGSRSRSSRTRAACDLVVRDRGPGIPDYAEDKVFEKFYSLARPATAKKSTGLGLSFVKEIAELHRGRVDAEERAPAAARSRRCRCRAAIAADACAAAPPGYEDWRSSAAGRRGTGPFERAPAGEVAAAEGGADRRGVGGSTPPGAAISPRIQRPCWATATAALPHSAIVNGLPQRVVRSTLTVFAGIFQPSLRLSWTRCGHRRCDLRRRWRRWRSRARELAARRRARRRPASPGRAAGREAGALRTRRLVHVEALVDLELQAHASLGRIRVGAHQLDALVRIVDPDVVAAGREDARGRTR